MVLQNSVSDASGSCSYSSSDTDSSSSSQGSSASSINPPHFSVTSSQTDGLRLTIATVRKSCSTPPPKDETSQSIDKVKGLTDKPTTADITSSSKSKVTDITENSINSVIKHLPSPKLSSSDSDTDCSESDSSTNSESRCTVKSNTSERKLAPKRDSPATRVKCLRKFSAKTSSNHKGSESSKTDSAKRTVRAREPATRVSPRCPPRGRGRPPLRGNKVRTIIQSLHTCVSSIYSNISYCLFVIYVCYVLSHCPFYMIYLCYIMLVYKLSCSYKLATE